MTQRTRMIGAALAGFMAIPMAMAAPVVVNEPAAAAVVAPVTAPVPAKPSSMPPFASGEMLANTCAGCHGTHGRIADSAFMPLAGMKEATFIKAMTDFRNGARPATLMGHVARGYSDEQNKLMAEFFAKVKP